MTIPLKNKSFRPCLTLTIVLFFIANAQAQYILIPMDAQGQSNHLKAYGIVYWHLDSNMNKVRWLLNYKGGAFLMDDHSSLKKECTIRGVSYQELSKSEYEALSSKINSPSNNQAEVILEKAPKIAVYTPPDKLPWDDAVTMALIYAEIPYETIYDKEVLDDVLLQYDWLHLHHEDFTGQFGKFYASYRATPWYINQKKQAIAFSNSLGYDKVSLEKLDVAKKIRDYVLGGGFMFAMCSATDSFDIALAAEDVDICEAMFDGDPSDPNYQSKINFSKTFAFENFTLERDPNFYEFSSIDMTNKRDIPKELDYFRLTEFSAKWDPVPTMLCQNHTSIVKGFMGQTTSFNPKEIKPNVMILGKCETNGEARYIHGVKGKGFFTFYGGHDPEDFQHFVGDPKTDLELHPSSPGYRLILNNVLFPAAKKKTHKT